MVYFIGLELGYPGEYAALAMLERSLGATAETPPRAAWFYTVRRLERFPPETTHRTVLEHVAGLFEQPPPEDAYLVVNQTGVGRPVVDAYRRASLPAAVRRVVLTGGAQRAYDGSTHHVPLRELTSVLQQVLQERRVKAEGQLPHAPTLMRELASFRLKRPNVGVETLDQWRERDRDDLVFAVGLAVWMAEREPPSFPETGLAEPPWRPSWLEDGPGWVPL